MWTADQLRARLGLQTNAGATQDDIQKFELRYELQLPAEFRALVAESNGATHAYLNYCLPSLSELPDWMEGGARFLLWQRFGYVPVADFGESNPYCVCCRGPLVGYIVQVRHDDAPRVGFHGLDEFLNNLETADRNGNLDDLKSPFDGNERTAADVNIARQLLVLANQLDDERDIVCDFGITLLADVGEISPWLNDHSLYVRKDAVRRLRQFNSPAARAAIELQDAAMRAFVLRCSELLTSEGFACSIENGQHLKVTHVPDSICTETGVPSALFQKLLDKWPLWISTSVFFGERANAGFEARFVQRVKELAMMQASNPF